METKTLRLVQVIPFLVNIAVKALFIGWKKTASRPQNVACRHNTKEVKTPVQNIDQTVVCIKQQCKSRVTEKCVFRRCAKNHLKRYFGKPKRFGEKLKHRICKPFPSDHQYNQLSTIDLIDKRLSSQIRKDEETKISIATVPSINEQNPAGLASSVMAGASELAAEDLAAAEPEAGGAEGAEEAEEESRGADVGHTVRQDGGQIRTTEAEATPLRLAVGEQYPAGLASSVMAGASELAAEDLAAAEPEAGGAEGAEEESRGADVGHTVRQDGGQIRTTEAEATPLRLAVGEQYPAGLASSVMAGASELAAEDLAAAEPEAGGAEEAEEESRGADVGLSRRASIIKSRSGCACDEHEPPGIQVDYASSPCSEVSSSPISSRALLIEFSETKSSVHRSRRVLKLINSNCCQSVESITSELVVEQRKCTVTKRSQREASRSKENVIPPSPKGKEAEGGPSSLFTVWEPVLAFR
ncbi:hypothetical protein GUITHDRAFT_111764 [Guillardia theta CCMP2712]|uniref:Uncharacterized protein n=1 Tax=Guillardia theta (strain CCMP2712) TaxID=905079 RepID=L1J0Y9_GUITC|nr:hypothetical protein GUITHDRAFT_111764 [Guillardia theta CCMP2712]EKX42198.1 hypothetical protein GUITHDRAFT_111764 [Guillardia theta CCMP2712]|eukprot:XP_005829178.1 hypothetical protein GUITHDRAFT_111764 [Guillardia theta CCMP2712]